MPRMFSVTIGGLSQGSCEHLIQIIEAGVAARASTQPPHRLRADTKLSTYIIGKLNEAREADGSNAPHQEPDLDQLLAMPDADIAKLVHDGDREKMRGAVERALAAVPPDRKP